ncbi:MAG: Ig-like domain-containing protein [Gammaproteobacteria bacterium]
MTVRSAILKASLFVFALVIGSVTALAGPTGGHAPNPAARPSSAITTVPPALRPVVYQALAEGAAPALRIHQDGCAVLAKPALRACFDARGVHFTGAGWLGLRLVAFGRSDALAPMHPTQPEITAKRVRYTHGNLTEWWRALPVGFEQGFTISQRPRGHGKLMLALAANNHAKQQNGTLAWGRLRYGRLVVTDANDKVIPATLKSKGGRILIAINDAKAAYPLTVDPLVWMQQQILIASDGAASDFFGTSMALEGDIAVVGSPQATVNGNLQQGAVYVFKQSAGAWSETAKLTADDGQSGDSFGLSVALDVPASAAPVILAGAPYRDNARGVAYEFTGHPDGTWTQNTEYSVDDGTDGDEFGWSVAVAGANYLFGAPGATVNGNLGQGKVYAIGVNQSQELVAGDGAEYDEFGLSVAVLGGVAVIGAGFANSFHGAAYLFQFDSIEGTWAQFQKLTPNDTEESLFGTSVAINSTDNDLLIGAPGDNTREGSAYVFVLGSSSWNETQKLTASDHAAGNSFGQSVAADGGNLLVGASLASVNGNEAQGAAYVFAKSSATWTQAQELTSSDGASNDNFGTSVGLAGATALIGAPNATVNGHEFQGAVYSFTSANPPPVAMDGTLAAEQNQPASGTLKATDANGDPLVFSVVKSPQHGDVVIDDPGAGTYTYTPEHNYTGADSFQFKANDGTNDSNTATISITVGQPPEASDGTLTTNKNQSASGTLKATDADGYPLTFSIVNVPLHGKVTLDDAGKGAYTYTPAKDYTGADDFQFKANDGHADSNVATIHITVKGSGNNAPVALAGKFKANNRGDHTSFQLQASDADGDPLTYIVVTEPKHGTLTINPKTGLADYVYGGGGDDRFSFKVSDGQADSNVATVVVESPVSAGAFGGLWLGLLALLALFAFRRRR